LNPDWPTLRKEKGLLYGLEIKGQNLAPAPKRPKKPDLGRFTRISNEERSQEKTREQYK
jgi:hypothetical protein